jgi:hypothetical protein
MEKSPTCKISIVQELNRKKGALGEKKTSTCQRDFLSLKGPSKSQEKKLGWFLFLLV